MEVFFAKMGVTNLRFKPAYNPYTEVYMLPLSLGLPAVADSHDLDALDSRHWRSSRGTKG